MLVSDVDAEFAWRIVEISTYTQAFQFSGAAKPVLIRGGIPLLYAHWEGFVKASTDAYLRYVCKIAPVCGDVVAPLRLLQFEKLISRYSAASTAEDKAANYQRIVKFPGSTFRRLPKEFVNTRSNLSSTVLAEVMMQAGLDASEFSPHSFFIDKKLLDRRNHIAHGKAIEVEGDEFIAIKDGVLDLLRLYKTQIENAVVLKRYLA